MFEALEHSLPWIIILEVLYLCLSTQIGTCYISGVPTLPLPRKKLVLLSEDQKTVKSLLL